jgi:hypothetical protein
MRTFVKLRVSFALVHLVLTDQRKTTYRTRMSYGISGAISRSFSIHAKSDVSANRDLTSDMRRRR